MDGAVTATAMKRFYAFIILSLFISETAYAKVVKLNCSFRDAYDTLANGRTFKYKTTDSQYRYISGDAIVTIDEARNFFEGQKADRFDDNIIQSTWIDDIKGPKGTVKLKKTWTINRYTGVLTKEVYSKIVGRDSSFKGPSTFRYDCRTAKKKF